MQYAYDAEGRLICAAQRMNPAAFGSLPGSACTLGTAGSFGPDRITHTTYDAADRPIEVRLGYGTPQVRLERTQTYTPDGLVDWIEDGMGNRSDYTYDGYNRLTKLNFPSTTVGAHAANPSDYEQYGFDAADNPITKVTRAGLTFTTTFDTLNRITLIDAPSGTNDGTFTYDLLSRQLTASHVGGQTITSAWDALGRKTSETGSLGAMAYQYDLAGRRTQMAWPAAYGGFVTYSWDLDNALRSILWTGASGITAYDYDNLGRRTTITRPNGVTTSYGYNTASQLTSLSHDLSGSTHDVTYGFSYTPAPQIAARTVSNALYDYTPTSGATAYTNNGLNQSTVAGGVAVEWSAQGNLTSDSVKTFTYDAANRLLTGGGSTLTYDPLDRLYSMTGTGAGRFQYDGSQLAAVLDGSGNLLGRYFAGPSPDEWAMWQDGGVNFWPLQDSQGSVIAITDGSGAATATLAYDEYGRPRSGNAGRMQYTGQMMLPDMGLQYYKARAYYAGLGRFVQTDPVGYEQGLNLYAYVHNDPVNRTDPPGTQDSNCAIVCTIFGGPAPNYSPTGIRTGSYNHEAALASLEISGYIAAVYQAAEAGIGLVAALPSLAKAAPEVIPLFRAVTRAEADDIAATGAFRLPEGGNEVKYFAMDRAGADRYAAEAASSFGESYTVIEAQVPSSIFSSPQISQLTVDGGIKTVTIPADLLPLVTVVTPK